MFETILVEKKGNVAVITINRPDKLNALNPKFTPREWPRWTSFGMTIEVRVVVITGCRGKIIYRRRRHQRVRRANAGHAAQSVSREDVF